MGAAGLAGNWLAKRPPLQWTSSISPSGATRPEPGSPDPILLARMHSLITFVLSCALYLLATGAHADIYSDVNRLVNKQQWAQAQTQAEAHLKTQPTDPQMRLLLSRIQDGQGQTSLAMETLLALTRSFPELPEPHNNLAALLARQNRYAEALDALQAAVLARPDYATALENLGDLYVTLAIQAYQKANKTMSTQPRVANKSLAAERLLKPSTP